MSQAYEFGKEAAGRFAKMAPMAGKVLGAIGRGAKPVGRALKNPWVMSAAATLPQTMAEYKGGVNPLAPGLKTGIDFDSVAEPLIAWGANTAALRAFPGTMRGSGGNLYKGMNAALLPGSTALVHGAVRGIKGAPEAGAQFRRIFQNIEDTTAAAKGVTGEVAAAAEGQGTDFNKTISGLRTQIGSLGEELGKVTAKDPKTGLSIGDETRAGLGSAVGGLGALGGELGKLQEKDPGTGQSAGEALRTSLVNAGESLGSVKDLSESNRKVAVPAGRLLSKADKALSGIAGFTRQYATPRNMAVTAGGIATAVLAWKILKYIRGSSQARKRRVQSRRVPGMLSNAQSRALARETAAYDLGRQAALTAG